MVRASRDLAGVQLDRVSRWVACRRVAGAGRADEPPEGARICRKWVAASSRDARGLGRGHGSASYGRMRWQCLRREL